MAGFRLKILTERSGFQLLGLGFTSFPAAGDFASADATKWLCPLETRNFRES